MSANAARPVVRPQLTWVPYEQRWGVVSVLVLVLVHPSGVSERAK